MSTSLIFAFLAAVFAVFWKLWRNRRDPVRTLKNLTLPERFVLVALITLVIELVKAVVL